MTTPIAPIHLLIVDDEPDLRESLGMLLRWEGFDISEAANGDEALALVRGGLLPHAILLDQRMPGLTGGETLDQLRAMKFNMPAVLVSAAADAHEIGARHGFDAVITKPVWAADLIAQLRRLLSGTAER